ncbi:lanthionine synthetase C family protein [Paenibacillus xylanexedens]|uniref:lanthionine synthetase C family protein n=1 Tax=Paenibacillus xylanexedens TaxID=528191 RepID=UPI000F52DFA9|nr:lanthionine synthetase C family protein [Paenibacillus xylanexedens]RPK26123.1 hypothetical protein EDO6_04678 [Paenibacillus xylanexedens]
MSIAINPNLDRWLGLEGDLRNNVASTLASVANRYKTPSEISMKSQNSILAVDGFEVERWTEESLSNGHSGICLLMGELDYLQPDAGWDYIGHQYLKELQNKLEQTGLHDLSLYGGLPGVLVAIRSLSRRGTRYQSMTEGIATWMEELAIKKVNELVENWGSTDLKIGDYDTILGLSGLGRVILSYYDRPGMKKVWEQIVNWFKLYCAKKEIGEETVPGWHISARSQFHASETNQYPSGNFNLGLSHGIAGPIALMSIAILKGLPAEPFKDQLSKLTDWLVQWKVNGEDGIYWPGRVSYEEWKLGNLHVENKMHPRDSWCYGTPGIARAIWLAGNALENKELSNLALESYLDMEKRIDMDGGLISPTVCHGLSGWLLLIQRMYSETGEERLRMMRDRLVEKTLDFYKADSIFGYCDINWIDNKLQYIDEAGLLNGAAGVSLVLASLLSDKSPEWDQVLLIK